MSRRLKLQVPLKPGSWLYRHFADFDGLRAGEARRLMELGLRSESLERVIERAIEAGLRNARVVVAEGAAGGSSDENSAAVQALQDSAGSWFDDE